MGRVRVGINLLYLKPGRVGGSEEYCRRVLRALELEAAEDVELTLFVNSRFQEAYPDLAAGHLTVIAPVSGDAPALRIAAESSWLARETARRPLDLVHHVANTLPQVRTRPAVVTIHDLQPLVRPQDFGRLKGAYLRSRLGPSARHARVVVTPSAYVRRLVIDRFARDPETVAVVPAPLWPAPPLTTLPDERRGLLATEAPFFLYPAITHPHKNHAVLLRAFAQVSAARPDVSLILTGGAGTREDAVLAEIARMGLREKVRRLGRIPRTDLDDLLRRAIALTFPSLHEGYGLPVAEAMSLGCPVVASNTTALPEVVGDAGLLVAPDDVDAWAEAMLRVMDDEATRARLVAAGRERARALTPAETARRSVAAYRLALR